ncbi:MAG: hypothetical protein ACJ72U_07040, partial [Nitrososphaeraceae archaeon]
GFYSSRILLYKLLQDLRVAKSSVVKVVFLAQVGSTTSSSSFLIEDEYVCTFIKVCVLVMTAIDDEDVSISEIYLLEHLAI